VCPRRGGHTDAAPAPSTTKASDDRDFGAHSRSFSTCSPTLRASCCHSRARLASGWLADLYREGVKPSGSLRKVSDHMLVLLSCSPDATRVHFRSPLGCSPARILLRTFDPTLTTAVFRTPPLGLVWGLRLNADPEGPHPHLPRSLSTRSVVHLELSSRVSLRHTLHGWPVRSPADASPTPSRMPAHGSGPMRLAMPSSRGTCTSYSLPVSPAHRNS
jgi:hypothetical protein